MAHRKQNKSSNGKLEHSSEDAINRIKWDNRYNMDDFEVGYLDRFKGILFTPLRDFNASEDETMMIPSHRVYQLRYMPNESIVWDREKKLDLLESIARFDTGEDEANRDAQPKKMVLENANWGWKQLKPYVPADALEQWLLERSDDTVARKCPTHISQLGAMYHVSTDLKGYLHAWEQSVLAAAETPFYVEEVRGSAFRLYADIDVKSRHPTPLDAVAAGWIRAVLAHTAEFFAPLSPVRGEALTRAIVTECHGPHRDSTDESICYKSGYRIYFTDICLDVQTYSWWLLSLQDAMSREFGDSCAWKDVIDSHSINWDRGRLFGTIKRRKNLARRYSFLGCYRLSSDPSHAQPQLIKDKLDAVYREDLRALLCGTTLRLWDDDRFACDGTEAKPGTKVRRLQDCLVHAWDVSYCCNALYRAISKPATSSMETSSKPATSSSTDQ